MSESVTPETTTDQRRRNDAGILASACAVLVAAYLLVIVSEERIAVRGFESHPLPHSCATRVAFNANCPGCGLTRGIIHLSRGRLSESLRLHRFAWLFALVILAQIPYRIVCLRTGNPAPLGHRFPTFVAWTVVVLLIGNWCVGLLFGD